MSARTPEQVRKRLCEDSQHLALEQPLSGGAQGALIHHLDDYLGNSFNRHVVMGWLFDEVPGMPMSSKKLTNGQWQAVRNWVKPFEVDGKWYVDHDFSQEIGPVLTEALIAYHRNIPANVRLELESTPDKLLAQAVAQLRGVCTAVFAEGEEPEMRTLPPHTRERISYPPPPEKRIYANLADFLGDNVL